MSRATHRLVLASVLGLIAVVAGCPWRRAAPPPEPIDEVALLAEADAISASPGAGADALAWSGWIAALHGNRADQARNRWNRAAALDRGAGAAWLGLGLEAELGLRPAEASRHYLSAAATRREPDIALTAVRRLPLVLGLDEEADGYAKVRLEALLGAEGTLPRVRVVARDVLAGLLAREGDLEGAVELLRTASAPPAFAVVGPFTPFRALDADRRFGPEADGRLLDRPDGPGFGSWPTRFGQVTPREVPASAAGLSLEGETPVGDGWYAVTDLIVDGPEEVLVRWLSSADLRLTVDGVEVARRRASEGEARTEGFVSLWLAPGRHRLTARLLDVSSDTALRLSVSTASGGPADLEWDLAELTRPLPAPDADTERVEVVGVEETRPDRWTDAVGPLLAGLAHEAVDAERSSEMLEAAAAAAPSSAWVALLSAQAARRDPGLPPTLRMGRASAAIDRARAAMPALAQAHLSTAELASDQGRHDAAESSLEEALRLSPSSVAAQLAGVELSASRGHGVLAREAAEELAQSHPRVCSVWETVLRLRKEDEDLAGADAAAAALRRCGRGGLMTWADHQSDRGDLASALEAYRRLMELEPAVVGHSLEYARLAWALGRTEEARERLEALRTTWPRSPTVVRRIAELAAEAGDAAVALRYRQQALQLDPGNLYLRRALAFARDEELLDWGALDLEEAIARYLASGFAERWGTDAALVVDHAVVEAFAEDPHLPVVVERIQTVTQVLTKNGIDRQGEVGIPDGAEVVTLYVRKPDGRRLDPEMVLGKDRISMPGLAPGDFIVADYLVSRGPRTAAMEGWTANAFYFRVFDLPLYRSTYVARAPRSLGLEVEAHNLEVETPSIEGDHLVFRHRVDEAAPIHPEVGSVSSDEFLPWLRIGAGSPPEVYAEVWGDYLVGHARVDHRVRAFAEQVRASLPDKAPVRAVAVAAAKAVDGAVAGDEPSTAFIDEGRHALLLGRGNRLLATRAVLSALGISSRVALVRPFGTPPGSRRFPAGDLFTYAVLRVDVEGTEPLWLDQNVRGTPLGALRPIHASRPALLLAEPGAPGEVVTTPPFPRDLERKESAIRLDVDSQGRVEADGVERYFGYGAAVTRSGLERVDDVRRKQAVESALVQTFGPLTLEDLAFEGDSSAVDPGTPLSIQFRLTADDWGVPRDGGLVVPGRLFPALLAPQLIRLAERETPLLLNTETIRTLKAVYRVPEGLSVAPESLEPVVLAGPFGRYTRTVEPGADGAVLEERLELALTRVAPDDYAALARFCSSVDEAQRRPLVFIPTPPATLSGPETARRRP